MNTTKVNMAKTMDLDIFVDDKFDNFIELNTNGIFCHLMDAPHNRRYNVGHRRLMSIKDLG